jgi:acetyltransferase-like isoleucine patch superfamily enzyme
VYLDAVRNDHRPFWLKRALTAYHRAWAERFLVPQLDAVGEGLVLFGPQHVEINGPRVRLGRHVHMMATRDRPIRFTVHAEPGGRIDVGDYVIVLPGSRFSSAVSIRIGNNCMFATNSYVTDADWHDVYDRTSAPGACAEVVLEDNVWIGDSAIVCKGVRIGKNSVIGAGAVVASDIPPDSIAVGNPARVIKQLDPDRSLVTRESLFQREESYAQWIYRFERYVLAPNTLRKWLSSLWAPTREL